MAIMIMMMIIRMDMMASAVSHLSAGKRPTRLALGDLGAGRRRARREEQLVFVYIF